MKCCMHYHSMGIIKIYFGKSQENLKNNFLAGILNYNRKGYPQQTFFEGWPKLKASLLTNHSPVDPDIAMLCKLN